jgi:hypothetical protein
MFRPRDWVWWPVQVQDGGSIFTSTVVNYLDSSNSWQFFEVTALVSVISSQRKQLWSNLCPPTMLSFRAAETIFIVTRTKEFLGLQTLSLQPPSRNKQFCCYPRSSILLAFQDTEMFILTRNQDTFLGLCFWSCNFLSKTNNFGSVLPSCLVSEVQKIISPGLEPKTAFGFMTFVSVSPLRNNFSFIYVA